MENYTFKVRRSLAERFAELAQLPVKDVTISIEPASVRILASIQVEDASSGIALKSSLASQLSSASATSALLEISAESTPTVTMTTSLKDLSPSSPVVSPPPSPFAPNDQSAVKTADQPNSDQTILIIIIAAGTGTAAVLAVAFAILWRKRMKRKTTSDAHTRPVAIVTSVSPDAVKLGPQCVETCPEIELNDESVIASSADLESSPSITMPIVHKFDEACNNGPPFIEPSKSPLVSAKQPQQVNAQVVSERVNRAREVATAEEARAAAKMKTSGDAKTKTMRTEQIKLLKELATLKEQGILTQEEFNQEKAAVLSSRARGEAKPPPVAGLQRSSSSEFGI